MEEDSGTVRDVREIMMSVGLVSVHNRTERADMYRHRH